MEREKLYFLHRDEDAYDNIVNVAISYFVGDERYYHNVSVKDNKIEEAEKLLEPTRKVLESLGYAYFSTIDYAPAHKYLGDKKLLDFYEKKGKVKGGEDEG